MVPYEFTDPYTGVVYLVGSVSELDAVAIADWEYDPPYTMYNLRGSLLAIVEFLTGPYYSVRRDGRLVGFFCYGHAARVKHRHSERYYRDTAYLDVAWPSSASLRTGLASVSDLWFSLAKATSECPVFA